MNRYGPNIVVIGAASGSFGLETIGGLLHEAEALRGARLTLVDIDELGLNRMAALAELANEVNGSPFEVGSSMDRRRALRGADFVIVSVEVDRFEAWEKDFTIPSSYGIEQVLGENGGPGGMSHSFRTIPLVLGIARDIEEICPRALVLNYTNPMTMVCMALSRYTKLRFVGICHQVNHAYYNVGRVMGWIEAPAGSDEEISEGREVSRRASIRAGGVNHLTFLTQIRDRTNGVDIYPEFAKRVADFDPGFEPVSRRVFEIFGLYPTGGDSHIGEYFGWARPSEAHRPRFGDLTARREQLVRRIDAAIRGEVSLQEMLDPRRRFGKDRAPFIISALVQGRPHLEDALNIVNDGSMPSLPQWSVVEVPAVVGPSDVRGVVMDGVPRAIDALLQARIAVQDLIVEAAVHGDRRLALQALELDPVSHPWAEALEDLLDELLKAHAAQLPQFGA